ANHLEIRTHFPVMCVHREKEIGNDDFTFGLILQRGFIHTPSIEAYKASNDWATRGLVKTDWTQAPFTASYHNININARVSSRPSLVAPILPIPCKVDRMIKD
ncbi:hypothetical protein Csa_023546, partial [Cucumis sativus]